MFLLLPYCCEMNYTSYTKLVGKMNKGKLKFVVYKKIYLYLFQFMLSSE